MRLSRVASLPTSPRLPVIRSSQCSVCVCVCVCATNVGSVVRSMPELGASPTKQEGRHKKNRPMWLLELCTVWREKMTTDRKEPGWERALVVASNNPDVSFQLSGCLLPILLTRPRSPRSQASRALIRLFFPCVSQYPDARDERNEQQRETSHDFHRRPVI